ncbi:MAG: hypothetical protein M3445_05835 [Actinomycetota bacterium]|nr:hypothetical protein [Actinomycetota bacterium]
MSLGLILCLGLTASPASADHEFTPTKPGANRQTFNYDDCFTGSFEGDTYTYCYKTTSTYKQIGTYDGKSFLYQDKFNSTSTFSINGSEPEVYTFSGNYMFKAKEGVPTISKSRYVSNFGDCSYSSRYLVVKGELKKDIFDFSCEPGI